MKTPITIPMRFKHITSSSVFEVHEDKIFKISLDQYIYIGFIHKYTRKGFYYIDLFANKSYITWSNFDDINKQDDDNLPNQLPLFPDTDEL